ncbi:MAG: glutamate synthase central domain-containing protein [Lachnospiraceae bacterium]
MTIRRCIDGIVKIASKMGISTIQSYQGLSRSLRRSASAVKSLISTLRIRSAA